MKTVLTTGGLGFIGSHTSIALLKQGFNVLIIDSLVNSKKETLGNIKKIAKQQIGEIEGRIFFREGDLRNQIWLNSIFEEFKNKNKPIESVIHFAGLKSIEESIRCPLKYWELNINSTLSLLSVMSNFSCNNLIFSSSASVYKENNNQKIIEDTILEPVSPYGNTKLCIEKMLKDIFKSKKDVWKIACLRYFNPVGAHESGLIGEDPKTNESNIFPSLIKVIRKELKELSIYGHDYPTKDGTCVRDYIHVMDLAEAHLATLLHLLENKPKYIYLNIGTGRGLSVLDLVNTFNRVNKCNIPYKLSERRNGDVPYLVADNSLALKLIKWTPKKSLEDICSDSWKWFISKKNSS